MATRTISNTGGNYNSTGTWVEGAVPTSADDVVATATSGQLTVNVSSAARSFNFTNYTNTLTMNSTWTVSGASLTNTFVSAMTIAGTSQLTLSGNNATIITNGISIPNIALSAGNINLGDTLNVTTNLSHSTTTLNGNGNSVNLSGNMNSSFQVLSSGTSSLTFNFTGTNQNLRSNFSGSSNSASDTFYINYSGTQYNPNGNGTGLQIINRAQATQINYVSGSFSSGFAMFFTGLVATPNTTLNFGSASNAGLKNLFLRTNVSSGLILGEDFPVENLEVSGGEADNVTIEIAGTGSIIAQNTRFSTSSLNVSGTIKTRGFTLNITPGPTHSFGNFGMLSVTESSLYGIDPSIHIKSTVTAGAKAAFSVTNKQSVMGGRFTDVEVVGNTLYVLDSVLTRTTNINVLPQYYYTAGGGGGGGSFTFVN
jgi:hypothetical protein